MAKIKLGATQKVYFTDPYSKETSYFVIKKPDNKDFVKLWNDASKVKGNDELETNQKLSDELAAKFLELIVDVEPGAIEYGDEELTKDHPEFKQILAEHYSDVLYKIAMDIFSIERVDKSFFQKSKSS